MCKLKCLAPYSGVGRKSGPRKNVASQKYYFLVSTIRYLGVSLPSAYISSVLKSPVWVCGENKVSYHGSLDVFFVCLPR